MYLSGPQSVLWGTRQISGALVRVNVKILVDTGRKVQKPAPAAALSCSGKLGIPPIEFVY